MADITTESDSSLESKRIQVTEKLQKREDERQADILKKFEDKKETVAKNENVTAFHDRLNADRAKIEELLSSSDSLDKSKLIEYFDSLVVSCQQINRYITEATFFLPAYDLQKSQETVSKLLASIQEKSDQLMPKKKFAFKNRSKANKKVEDKQPEVKVQANTAASTLDMTDGALTNEIGKDLEKRASDVTDKDLALANLTDCTVRLYGSPGALHINKLSNCKVFCGPVSGSIFIDNCTGCTFVMPCQQMRIHTTTKSHFYIHVTSRAIIEDCSAVEFAPYTWSYPQLQDHYQVSGLDQTRNTWNDVDDFNWLASDKPSPNWQILPENQRKDWKNY